MVSSAVGPVMGATTTIAAHHIHRVDCNAPVADVPDLPTGFPETVVVESAWTGPQFHNQSQYTYNLTSADLDELTAALNHFKGMLRSALNSVRRLTFGTKLALGLDGDLVSRTNFPLPTLGTALDRIALDIHHGKGFAVVRGIDPKKYTVEDLTILYLGIQGYIANQRGRQDKKGNMLGM